MFFYYPTAITYKNINKFSYETYTNIGINLLKYNNDSSAVVRVLDALNSATRETLDDLPYSMMLNVADKSYKQIDRLNKFFIDYIQGINIERTEESVFCDTPIIGYSKYTDTEYTLEYVADKNDFVRHSYPCDCFLAHSVPHVDPIIITLTPNLWKDINQVVNSSSITIKPIGPMDSTTKNLSNYITIRIEGINTRNEFVTEDINIDTWTEYMSDREFIFIKRMKVLNSYISYDIIFYPFLNGKETIWNQIVTDREEFDRHNAIVKFNYLTKSIDFEIVHDESVSFPVPTELTKSIMLSGMDDHETVYDYFIDQSNGLFYTITSLNRLFCYPFIIPKAVNNTIDDQKTLYQSCKIDYFEDAINQKFVFDIFPTSKANNIDTLDIYINNRLWADGLILDLFREKLIDNRMDIPFFELFKDSDSCMIEFRSYGFEDSSFFVYVIKPQITPLYIKDLTSIASYNNAYDPSYSLPDDTSTMNGYPASVSSGLALSSNSHIYKLSKYGNIIIDGKLITDVFKTFYYASDDSSIITQDTITAIKAG